MHLYRHNSFSTHIQWDKLFVGLFMYYWYDIPSPLRAAQAPLHSGAFRGVTKTLRWLHVLVVTLNKILSWSSRLSHHSLIQILFYHYYPSGAYQTPHMWRHAENVVTGMWISSVEIDGTRDELPSQHRRKAPKTFLLCLEHCKLCKLINYKHIFIYISHTLLYALLYWHLAQKASTYMWL